MHAQLDVKKYLCRLIQIRVGGGGWSRFFIRFTSGTLLRGRRCGRAVVGRFRGYYEVLVRFLPMETDCQSGKHDGHNKDKRHKEGKKVRFRSTMLRKYSSSGCRMICPHNVDIVAGKKVGGVLQAWEEGCRHQRLRAPDSPSTLLAPAYNLEPPNSPYRSN